MKAAAKGFTLVELLVVVAIIGIIAGIAIPNLLNAVDKGKQKRTISDLRAIGTAIESYSVDVGNYPVSADIPTLKSLIDPYMIRNIPLVDAWQHSIQQESSTAAYTIFSQGKDGIGTDCTAGYTGQFTDEICFTGGRFVRYPDGMQQ